MADESSYEAVLRDLLEVSKALGREVTLENLLSLILDKTTHMMQAERSSLFLYDARTDELWSKIAQGVEVQEIRFPVGLGIAGDVAKTRQVANIPDAYLDPRFNAEFDRRHGYRTKSVLCLPMVSSEGSLVGVIETLNKVSGEPFDQRDEELLDALASQAAVALQRAQLIEAYVEGQKMEETLRLAREIQMSLLPTDYSLSSRAEGVIDVYGTIESAKEVGGDLYDFFLTDDSHLCLAIGDVTGKGVPAALFMAVAKTVLRAVASAEMHPGQIVARVNDYLSANNDATMFITFFCCILDLNTGIVEYSNGGHNPPYHLRAARPPCMLRPTGGAALGVFAGMDFASEKLQLEPGDTLYLYTDGVNEAMDEQHQQFSYARLEPLLGEQACLPAKELAGATFQAIRSFVGRTPQSDDITILIVRWLGPPARRG